MKKMRFILALLAGAAILIAGCSKNNGNDPATYTIIITGDGQTNRGTVVLSKSEAEAGDEITATATPTDGYGFVKWVVTGMTLNDATENPVTFIMPAGNVTIRAEFYEEVLTGSDIDGWENQGQVGADADEQ